VISAALDLAAQGGYEVEDIEKIEADFRSFSLSRQEARDTQEVSFCAPFLIAASLVHGFFGPRQITPAAIDDDRVQKLSRRVVQIPNSDGEGNVVTLHLRGGKSLSARARGERAFEPEFIRRKFQECASAVLNPHAVDEILETVDRFEEQPWVRRLMQLARGGTFVP
jgi:2-methylcitrate dehydratase PrpD